jgi:hypothetical protein
MCAARKALRNRSLNRHGSSFSPDLDPSLSTITGVECLIQNSTFFGSEMKVSKTPTTYPIPTFSPRKSSSFDSLSLAQDDPEPGPTGGP